MPNPKRPRTLRDHFVVALSGFPFGLVAAHFLGLASGLPTTLATAMIVYAVWWRWDLSDRRWFWMIIAGLAAMHIVLISTVHWTTQWIPAFISTPFCYLDFLLMLRIFNWGENQFDQVSGRHNATPPTS
jgi:hypothetical protein